MKKSLFAVLCLSLFALIVPRMVVEAQATFGTNWTAQFFPSTNFTGSPVAASYPNGLNFIWNGIPTQSDNITPVAGFGLSDNFSVRFASAQNFPQAGNYQFFGQADDQIKIFIDGIEVLNQAVPGSFVVNFTIVTAGSHTLTVELVELTSTAIIQFQWQFTGAAPPPGATAVPTQPQGPFGQVVYVRGLSLRSGPYLGASFIAVLRPQTQYPVRAMNNDEGGGYTWYKVINGDQVGWASGRYLIVDGPVPEEGTVFQTLVNPPDLGVIGVPNAFMNLRVRPSVRSPRIGQVAWGDEVSVIGRTIQGGRSHWYQVRYNGLVGWIYAPYVRIIRGGLGLVPVY